METKRKKLTQKRAIRKKKENALNIKIFIKVSFGIVIWLKVRLKIFFLRFTQKKNNKFDVI